MKPVNSPATHEDPAMPGLGRRSVLAAGAVGTVGTAALIAAPTTAGAATTYFRHGVASGDPLPTGAVIWTRVTPTAAATPGSGAGPRVTVRWQVSTDARFSTIVRQGSIGTGPARDHTVKVDVAGLKPGRGYYYRFVYSGQRSRVGRFKTAPAYTADPSRLRFGIVSCSNLQAGWFSAYRHLADRNDLDAILHLGDYLYEYAPGEYGYGQADKDIRSHRPAREMVSLADYRQRHAQYKQDPDLQRLHARYGFITTWDDHEWTNDSWRDGAENHQPETEGDWPARRAAAVRAYDEWMPVRLSGTAVAGDGTQLYRRLRFGRLMELSMLDLRSYRDQQVSNPFDPKIGSTARSITGDAQMRWLKGSLNDSRAQWKVIGNSVMISPVTFGGLPDDMIKPVEDTTGLIPPDGTPWNVDQWDGYTADRREVVQHLRDNAVQNTVFVTGDIHSAWACELPANKAEYPIKKETAGVEFVATSVTSNNLKDILNVKPRTLSLTVEGILKASNLHVKHLNFDDHGFSVLDITPQRAQMDWYVIGDRADRNAGVRWQTSYATDSGTQKLRKVSSPVAGA